MANGHGGARVGAGRRKKSLSEAVIDGTHAERLKTVNFDSVPNLLNAEGLPTAPELLDYLKDTQKEGALSAELFFGNIWKWLTERKCEKLFESTYLQRFAMQQARYVQLERLVSEHGFLAEGAKGATISPLEEILITRLKIVNAMQSYIEGVVRENCAEAFNGLTGIEDPMEALLNGR